MTFSRYFKASSCCLIGAGFVALAATGSVDAISIVLFTAVFISSWFLDTDRIRQSIPKWLLICISGAWLTFCAVDYRLFTRSLVVTFFHLIIFAAAVKLLTVSKDRDYLLLYLISFAELLAASTLTANIVFAGCFLAFLLSGISTLILFEMRRTHARMQDQTRVQPLVVPRQLRGTGFELFSPFPAGLFSAIVIGIAALILAVAVPVFFLLPRVNWGMYRHPSGKTQFTSGFSDTVELGRIGDIKQSDVVVMRVKTDKPPSEMPLDLKWRGLSFDYYDGRVWKRTDQSRRAVPIQGWYYKLENSTQGTNLIRQTLFLEPMSTDVIFATHKALALSRDVGLLWRDSSDSLYAAKPLTAKLRYSAVSDPIRPDPSNISDLRPIPSEVQKAYTQVPPEDPRIAELAKQVTRSAKDRYGKAQALEKYLRTHYSYSLVLRGTPHSRDPLAMFLFDVQKGHCEYFASAMTIMLRQIGIPARLVNGFRIGEYNAIGNNWTVRQYDAHSWVEAYFPPYGWIEFDPTPPEPEHPRSAFQRVISNLADAIDLWWWDGVVNYDSSKQYQVISALRMTMESFQLGIKGLAARTREKIRTGAASVRSPHLASSLASRWAIWFSCITMAILLMIRPLRRKISGSVRPVLYRRNEKVVATDFYRRAIILLGNQGIMRSYGQTPIEFARSLGNHPAAIPLLSLTHMYNAVRFGAPGSSFNQSEAQAFLHTLRAALNKDASSSL